jgi:hypothetical protein
MVHDLSFADRSRVESSQIAEITLPFSKDIHPSKELLFALKGKKNDLLFLTMSLAFETVTSKSGTVLADTAWQPAAVLGVGRRKG